MNISCRLAMVAALLVIIINPVLIRFYPRERGWLDLPHSASNLSHSLKHHVSLPYNIADLTQLR